jgi:hypothetical protein
VGFDYGDVVQMKRSEGEIPAGSRGIVLGTYGLGDGGLVVVRFEKATRLIHASSLRPIDGDGSVEKSRLTRSA